MVIKEALQNLREDADNQFILVFKNIIELEKKTYVEIYYKQSIFLHILNYLIESMNNTFRLNAIFFS